MVFQEGMIKYGMQIAHISKYIFMKQEIQINVSLLFVSKVNAYLLVGIGIYCTLFIWKPKCEFKRCLSLVHPTINTLLGIDRSRPAVWEPMTQNNDTSEIPILNWCCHIILLVSAVCVVCYLVSGALAVARPRVSPYVTALLSFNRT